LKGCGFSTEAVTHPAHVLRALEAGPFDAVLLDLNYTRDTTAGEGGLELVSQIRSMDKLLPVVVMTAWGSVDQALAAMGRGASDLCRSPGRIGGFCSSARGMSRAKQSLKSRGQLENTRSLVRALQMISDNQFLFGFVLYTRR
jgi:DNA-binding NtrC family response regulator